MGASTPAEFFGDDPVGIETFERVYAALVQTHPDVTVRVSKSQIAFRRRRGFAYLWVPGHYLRHPGAPVVLSLALRHRIPSDRFKEVVHPRLWMHHLEVRRPDQVDVEVLGWLELAAQDAGEAAYDSAMSEETPLPNIGAPATRALTGAGYRSLQDLDGVSRGSLLALHGVGPRAIRILEEAMGQRALSLSE